MKRSIVVVEREEEGAVVEGGFLDGVDVASLDQNLGDEGRGGGGGRRGHTGSCVMWPHSW